MVVTVVMVVDTYRREKYVVGLGKLENSSWGRRSGVMGYVRVSS